MVDMTGLSGKKIALISPLPENDGGGIESYIRAEMKALKSLGANVQIIRNESKSSKLRFTGQAYSSLRDFRPDIVHAHADWGALLPGVLYKQFHKGKLHFTLHTWDASKAMNPARLLIYKRLVRKCDSVIYVCESQMKMVSPIIKSKNVINVMPPGIESSFGVGEPHPGINVCHLGRFVWPGKSAGAKLLIESFGGVVGAKLIIAGEGALLEELKSQVRAANVEFPGQADSANILASCDIYAHITFQDWMPLAIIEAMHAGKPIVASNVGGIPEALGGLGMCVENETADISNALKTLASDAGLREHMGSMLQARARKEYSTESFAKRLEATFSDE